VKERERKVWRRGTVEGERQIRGEGGIKERGRYRGEVRVEV